MSSPNDEAALNLAIVLGAVHDMGKAPPVFQIQKGYNSSPDLDKMLLEKPALFQGDSLRLFPHKRGVALEEYA